MISIMKHLATCLMLLPLASSFTNNPHLFMVNKRAFSSFRAGFIPSSRTWVDDRQHSLQFKPHSRTITVRGVGASSYERREQFFEPEISKINNLVLQILPHDIITKIQLIKSGLSNTNYLIQMDNEKKYILRFYVRDIKSGKKEYNISQLLHGEPLVPNIIYYMDNNLDIKYPFSLSEFHEGVLLSDYLRNKDYCKYLINVYYELGVFLANIRKNYKFKEEGLLTSDLTVEYINTKTKGYNTNTCYILDCLDNKRLQERLGLDTCKELMQVVKKKDNLFSTVSMNSNSACLVHGDFKPENILVLKNKETIALSAILDWEFSYSGMFYGDIATLFRISHKMSREYKQSFMSGYSSLGEIIDADWEKKAKLTDLVNLCDFLTSDKDRPILYRHVIKLINNSIKFLK